MRQIENKIQIIKGSLYWGLLAVENKNIPLEMRGKIAWVVTDCMNGACGMERKETTEAVRC